MHIDPAHQSVKFCQTVSNALMKRRAMIEISYILQEKEKKMKSNIKRLSLCLSVLMLLILASPLTVLAAEEETAASAKFYGTFWS